MDTVTFVELRDARGVTTARLRVEGETISVGRAPENAVVVDDEYVDAYHLDVLVRDETVLARDLGSINGTQLGGEIYRDAEIATSYGQPISIGETTVVFLSPGAPVEKAKRLPEDGRRLVPYHRLPVWTPALLLVACMTALTSWSSYEAVSVGSTFGLVAAFAILALAWTGFWAIGSRVLGGVAHFREHLAFASLYCLGLLPVSFVFEWIVFSVGSSLFEQVMWGVHAFGLWGLLLFGHIDVASRRTTLRKAATAAAASSALVVSAFFLSRFETTPAEDIQRRLGSVPAVPTYLTRSGSLEQFLSELGEIEVALYREASGADVE